VVSFNETGGWQRFKGAPLNLQAKFVILSGFLLGYVPIDGTLLLEQNSHTVFVPFNETF
jgi:hypothetical protein